MLVSVVVSVDCARGEVYVAGYFGGARTHAATITLNQPVREVRLAFEQVPFRGRSFASPVYYGYRAGYFFTTQFGVEAEFIHLKVHANLTKPVSIQGTIGSAVVREQAPMSRYVTQFEVSHGLNMVLINVVFRRALAGGRNTSNARLALTGRGGVGPTIPRPEVNILGESGGAYQRGPIAVQGAAGIEARVVRGLRALAEYKYTFTPTSFDIPGGNATFAVHSQHLLTGFAIHF